MVHPVDVGPAPAFSGVVSDHVAPKATNDSNTPNLSRRVSRNREGSTPHSTKRKNIVSCKNSTILALSMHAPLPLEGAYKNLV